MANIYLGNAQLGKGGIAPVNTLPTANAENYNKHELYLNDGELKYLDKQLSSTPTQRTNTSVLPNISSGAFTNNNIKVVYNSEKIYYVDFSSTANIYEFNPETLESSVVMSVDNSIKSALGQLPNIALVGNCIYCLGTYNVRNAYKFNLETKETTIYQDAGVIANRTSIGVYETYIYVIGGYNDNRAIRRFDTTSNTLTTLPTQMPTDTRASGTITIGNKLYMFGTQNGSSDIYIFNMQTETISKANATLPYASSGGGSFYVHDNKIDILWTEGVSSYSNNYIMQYDIEADTCVTLDATMNFSTHTYLYTFAQFGNKLFIFSKISNRDVYEYYYDYVYEYKTLASSDLVTTISFTIGSTTYQAEEGMTWNEWVASAYNTNGWQVSNTRIINDTQTRYVTYAGYEIAKTDVIVADRVYSTAIGGGGGNND